MKTKRLALWAILVTVGLAFSYFESFIPLSAIAPGLKLGLANLVVLLLLNSGDIKGAYAVNTIRVCIASLLFGTPMSFAFSITGALLSTTAMALVSKAKNVSPFGAGILGGAVHNIGQLIMAAAVFKTFSVFSLVPWLTLIGAACGALTGFTVLLLIKNKHINNLFSR